MSDLNPTIYKVTFGNNGQVVDCPSNRAILYAAVAAGLDYPYGCASGNCGAYVCHAFSGEVSLLSHSDTSLSPAQKADGQTLAYGRNRARTWRSLG